jgi:hypothetical protein
MVEQLAKTVACILLVAAILSPTGSASADTDFILDIVPGYILFSTDLDGAKVTDGKRVEEIDGYLSNMPILTGGLGINKEKMFIDLTGGLGYLFNSSFTSVMYLFDAAGRFKFSDDRMTVGPHFSLVYFQPSWDGDLDISLSNEAGFILGATLTVGTRPFSFLASLDYVNASLGVDAPDASVSQDDLDLSGIAIQLGLILRF